MPAELARGFPDPLGATPLDGGVNFSVFANKAQAVELLLFDRAGDASPAQVFHLDPARHRTYHYWHAFVPGVGAGQIYAYRAIGDKAKVREAAKEGLAVLGEDKVLERLAAESDPVSHEVTKARRGLN